MPEPGEPQTCPRRMLELGGWARTEGLDTWDLRSSMADREPVGLVCSFCGSLNPDRFIELARAGWLVGPTDKNYKVYLAKPLTDEEQAERRASWLASFTPLEVRAVADGAGKTPEEYRAELEAVYEQQVAPTVQGSTEAKFYLQHLSVEQQGEFIRLYNEGGMKVGYPGHLYVLPYFAQPGPAHAGS